jgi:hypothetical protein
MPQKSIFINFFRNVNRVFYNVLIMALEHVRCLTAEQSSTEYTVMYQNINKEVF